MTKNKSKVAVVMPSYNCEQYVALTLRTLLDQEYDNYKIFAVNDGSKDRTLDIVNEFQKKHPNKIVVSSKENGGAGDALNQGFRLVENDGEYDYATMVSSDNLYYRNFLSALVHVLDSTPESTVMAYGNFHYIDPSNKIIKAVIHEPKPDEDLVYGYDQGPAFLYRMSAKKKAGDYWRRICEDYHMAIKLREYGTFELVPLLLMGFRVRGGQLTGSDGEEEKRAAEYCRRLARKIIHGEHSQPEDVYPIGIDPMVHRYDWEVLSQD